MPLVECGPEQLVVEPWVQRITSDMGDLVGQHRAVVANQQTSEHPLVDESQVDPLAELEHHAQVSFAFRSARLDEQLSAHAEVAEQRVTGLEGKPDVFPASSR